MPKVIKIYGPPGTGKTTTLISILKTVLESGVLPTRVAYITHTKAACEEVKSRVFEQLGISKKEMKWFRTIHSLCCGMTQITYNDIWGYKDAQDFKRDTGYYIKGNFDVEALEEFGVEDEGYDVVLFADQLAKSQCKDLAEIVPMMPPSAKLLNPHEFLDTYDAWKNENGKKDFTDMLLEYRDGQYDPGEVDVVIVDEAQDLSKLQWQIVEKYAANADELYIAGDDDQSIYKFLGADEYGFLDHEADETRVLTHSYRCPHVVGTRATSIIRNIEQRQDKEVDWKDAEAEVQVYNNDPMFLPWADWASGESTCMVLTRHRRQMYDVRKMLNKMKIPHTVGGKSMATSPMGKMIRVYLELIHDTMRFRPSVVGQMLEAIGDKTQARKIRDLGVKDRKITLSREDIVIPYVDDWPSLFTDKRHELAQILVLRQQINEFGLGIIGPMPNIDISTYHSSKGREADHVVLYTDCYKSTWDEQQDNPDSEIRLAYVGITRSKGSVTIITPRTMMYLTALV